MVKILDRLLGKIRSVSPSEEPEATGVPTLSVDDLSDIQASAGSPVMMKDFTGEKFYKGYGPTVLFTTDYYTLRERSAELFKSNHYARGIIRRYITNVINTGLELECKPEEVILGFKESDLADWTEMTENRFRLWAANPKLCDYLGVSTFGELQRTIKREALVSGDILVVMRISKQTGLPQVQLINGKSISGQSSDKLAKGYTVEHGVELDPDRRKVAFHIQQEAGEPQRLPAYDKKTGRRIAWMVYGTDKRHDDVRGEPLLSIILQALKEIDRYMSAAQRKAVVNSLIAMFIQRDADGPASMPMTDGAVKNENFSIQGDSEEARTYKLSGMNAGHVIQGLQKGEKPVQVGGQGTDVNFQIFEEAVLGSIAWALEMPPEILKLSFSNNYSASQAAINEYKIFLNPERKQMSDAFCKPVYEEWAISESHKGTFNAPGFLQAWRDPSKFYEYSAWLMSDWTGAIKPSTDLLKQVKGYKEALALGLITRDRVCKELFGMKYSKVIKQLERENVQLADALKILFETEAQASQPVQNGSNTQNASALAEYVDAYMDDNIDELIESKLEERAIEKGD